MSKRVRLADIAEALNVSTVTVSKALSDQKGVSEEVRRKIKELADQLGYRQPSQIKSESRRGNYNIGILAPEYNFGNYQSFYWQLYQEVSTKALQKGCFTILEVISAQDEKELRTPRLLEEDRIDGIILIGRPTEAYLEMIGGQDRVPLVCLDFFEGTSKYDAVISDGFYGTYMLTNHLFDMGHEDIAFLGTIYANGSIMDRGLGYVKAMLEHGKEIRKDRIINDRESDGSFIGQGMKIKYPENMPTAFVCNCDLSASALIKELRGMGRRIPEDISVAGFDHYLYPGLCDIELTTYEVDLKAMASKSIDFIVRKIANSNYKPGVRIIQGHIIYGQSVARRTEGGGSEA